MLDSSFSSVVGDALCCTSPPSFTRQTFPPLVTFSIFPLSLSLFLPCILFSRRGFSCPTPPRPVQRIWCLLTGSCSSSRFPRRYCTILYCTVLYCTVLYCTVLYCTVLYASFDVMVVGTSGLICGFNWQCTADAIDYAVMITPRLDSLPSPHSLPRFGSTPAGRQPG